MQERAVSNLTRALPGMSPGPVPVQGAADRLQALRRRRVRAAAVRPGHVRAVPPRKVFVSRGCRGLHRVPARQVPDARGGDNRRPAELQVVHSAGPNPHAASLPPDDRANPRAQPVNNGCEQTGNESAGAHADTGRCEVCVWVCIGRWARRGVATSDARLDRLASLEGAQDGWYRAEWGAWVWCE